MKPLISKYVDIQKISETLGIEWKNLEIPSLSEYSNKQEDRIIENTFIFELENNQVFLEVTIQNPKRKTSDQIQLRTAFDSFENLFLFNKITRVLYNPKLKEVIFESKNKQYFSELMINSKGKCISAINIPRSNYQNSWIQVRAENLQLLPYHHSEIRNGIEK